MENEHTYRVVAWWASGKTGLVKSDSAPNAIHFTTPPQFGGMEGRWSPEDLLLSATGGFAWLCGDALQTALPAESFDLVSMISFRYCATTLRSNCTP